ncbi:MAG: hypothetical protein HGA86_06455 [Anaerolineaceae bacterium]|nr:hypothetical protein [Anaerolineaceae bacterium]
MSKGKFIFWIILLLAFALAGLLMLAAFLTSFGWLKSILDALSRDGSFDSLTNERFTSLRLPALTASALFLAIAAAGLFLRRASQRTAGWLWDLPGRLLRQFKADAAVLHAERKTWRPARGTLLGVAALTLLGLVARYFFLNNPMRHDEAYTYLTYVIQPWKYMLSDYSMPNNHIFHNVLVKLVTGVLGMQPWAIRLPAFIAGALVVPAGYWFARRFYNRTTAFLAAGAVAFLPDLIDFSTNARGYTMVALFTLILFGLGLRLRKQPNLVLWGVCILITALGFWTMPVFLYPAGIFYTWLLLDMLAGGGGVDNPRPRMFKYLVWSLAAAGVLTLLLYLPVMLRFGPMQLVSNQTVLPIPANTFLANMRVRLTETWAEWNLDLPFWLHWVFAGGLLLSLVFHWRATRTPIPILAASVLFIAVEVAILRPNTWPRLFQFILPMAVIWACAGWVALMDWIASYIPKRIPLSAAMAALALLAMTGASAARVVQVSPGYLPSTLLQLVGYPFR